MAGGFVTLTAGTLHTLDMDSTEHAYNLPTDSTYNPTGCCMPTVLQLLTGVGGGRGQYLHVTGVCEV